MGYNDPLELFGPPFGCEADKYDVWWLAAYLGSADGSNFPSNHVFLHHKILPNSFL